MCITMCYDTVLFCIDTSLYYILQDNLAKKRSLTKQSKMPELAENSETESLKGSGGSLDPEAELAARDQDYAAAVSQNYHAFPSLPDDTLKRLGLQRKKGEPYER